MPRAPALVASPVRAVWLEPEGAPETLAPTEAAVRARGRPPLAVHGPATSRRLDGDARPFRSYDLLELFAFGAAEIMVSVLPAGRDPEASRRRTLEFLGEFARTL